MREEAQRLLRDRDPVVERHRGQISAGGDDRIGRYAARVERNGKIAWAGLVVLAGLAVAVFWAFDALPFQDLPAHAGLIAMRHRFAGSAFEQQHYVLAPHIGPYSVFRFLGELLVRVTTPLGAVRALGTLPVLALPLALLFARRLLHGDRSPTYGYLGVALSFGIMTLLGFASYLLGFAAMVVGVALWLDLLAHVDAGKDAGRRELVVTAYAPLLFVAHGHAFLLFLACAGIATILGGPRWPRLFRLRALVPALCLAAYVAWIERGATTPPGSVPRVRAPVPRFQGLADKLGLTVTSTLMTRLGVDLVASIVLLALAIVGAVATVRALRGATRTDPARALLAGAAAMTVAFAALPHAIGWFGFVDGRLVPAALVLALLAIDGRTPRVYALLRRLAPVLAAAIVGVVLVASARFQDEARGYREVLGHVRGESRLLNLPLDPDSSVFVAHPFVHYDKLALVDRPLVVSDVWFHQGSALYPTAANPVLRLPSTYSESNLKSIDWPAYHLEDWDYVLIRVRPDGTPPPVPQTLALEASAGGWWLYRSTTGEHR